MEAIKARYQDITKLSTDVAKTLDQALQLARRLHSTHEELCAWLDKVEVELLSYETQVLKGEASSQAHARQKVRSDLYTLWIRLLSLREPYSHRGKVIFITCHY